MKPEASPFTRILFSTAFLTAALALAVVTALNPDLMENAHSRLSYFFVSLLVGIWVWSIWKARSEYPAPRGLVRRWWPGILLAGVLTVTTTVSVEKSYRVLGDEANMLAVSRSMTFEKRVDNVTQGYQYYRNFFREPGLDAGVEKHPLLFPYFTHLVHAFTGYRAENAFVLNGFVLFGVLLLVYVLLIRFWSPVWALAAQVLVAAQPLVAQCATSAGFDLFNAFFALVVYLAIAFFLERPDSEKRFAVLWASLILYGQTRQESVTFLAITLGALMAARLLKKSFFTSSYIYALTPLTYLPLFWQRLLIKDAYENGPDEVPFSLGNFIHNNVDWVKTLFRFDFFLPWATPVNLIGIAGLVYLIRRAWGAWVQREPRFIRDRQHLLFMVVLAATLIHWTVVTAYFRGIPSHPTNARYFTLFTIQLAVLAVYLLRSAGPVKHRPGFLIALAVGCFAVYHPIAIEGRFSNAQTAPREYNFTLNYLKKNAPKHALIISNRPGYYTIHDWGAIGVGLANKKRAQILGNYRRHLYEALYVIQSVEYKTMQPVPQDRLHAEYRLQSVAAIQNTATHFVRISKVVLPGQDTLPSGPLLTPAPKVPASLPAPETQAADKPGEAAAALPDSRPAG